MFTDESFISQAIKAGAKGYLHKNTTREEMLIAIDTIYSGNDFFSQGQRKKKVKNKWVVNNFAVKINSLNLQSNAE